MRPLTGYRRKPWGLGVHAPARGQDHKWGTHTLPSSERQGSPRNHSSPRDPPYQWGTNSGGRADSDTWKGSSHYGIATPREKGHRSNLSQGGERERVLCPRV